MCRGGPKPGGVVPSKTPIEPPVSPPVALSVIPSGPGITYPSPGPRTITSAPVVCPCACASRWDDTASARVQSVIATYLQQRGQTPRYGRIGSVPSTELWNQG